MGSDTGGLTGSDMIVFRERGATVMHISPGERQAAAEEHIGDDTGRPNVRLGK